jgi:hypothetical protein
MQHNNHITKHHHYYDLLAKFSTLVTAVYVIKAVTAEHTPHLGAVPIVATFCHVKIFYHANGDDHMLRERGAGLVPADTFQVKTPSDHSLRCSLLKSEKGNRIPPPRSLNTRWTTALAPIE